MAKIPSRIIHTTPPCNCGLSLKSVWFKSDFFSSQKFLLRENVWRSFPSEENEGTLCEWWWSTHREDIHWNYLKKMFLNWCNSSLLKEGRSQLGWYLNAKARKYLNTTGEDPTKIGRWRDSLRRRTWKGKFVAAWKTCLHPLYLHPVTANQSQSERSRKGKGVLRKRLQWKQRIRDRKKRKYKLGAHLTCKRGVNGELWQELW